MRNKFLQYILLTFLIFPACTGDFEEINTPPTRPAAVPSEFSLSHVQYRSVREKGNSWTNQILQWGAWIQHYGNHNQGFTTAHYQDILNYNDDFWNNMYGNMNNARKGKELAEAQDAPNIATQKIAIFEIMEILNWICLTDMVGDVPYFGALQGGADLTPSYDAQQQIYADLAQRLEDAVNSLDPNDGAFFGSADLFFQGDPEKWIKFGNALRLRIALRLSKVDPGTAQAQATAVMNSGLLPSSNDDDAVLPTENSGTVFSDMHRAAELLIRSPADAPFLGEAFIQTMIDKNDPRLPIIAAPTPRSVAAGGDLEYRGVSPALSDAQYADVNANLDFYSRPNGVLFAGPTTTRGQTSMSYAEVSFAKAEAALRGWGGTEADAQTFFEEGIRAALSRGDFLNFGITQQDIDDYVTANGTLTGSFDEKLEQIMVEKWQAFALDQEDEAFSEWRRTGYPVLDPGQNLGDTGGTIPRRLTYSNDEPLLNPANYDNAVSKLPNGDTYTSRVWWDQ
ncbi:MAG: SusD/RagB family nutrient-binding outer membrane lipoprotein [Saprospiraceae bacterium]|nr:SusD/RagB family nutrient-binding outer membrane lipoprotein [Saprospiraceae bacterium]